MSAPRVALAVALVLAALSACTRRPPNLPITEQGISFPSLNASMPGEAPPVAQGVTFAV